MKTFSVTLPVAGHIIVEVEAADGEAAIAKALDMSFTERDINDFEVLEHFHRGNVCYCPRPWDAVSECVSEDEGEDA